MVNFGVFIPLSENSAPGEKLRYYRVAKGLSREELAEKIGLSQQGIINFEKGINNIFQHDAEQFAAILNVDPGEFLNEYTNFCREGYGARIASIRKAYGMSQIEFSEMLGVTRSTVSIWEAEINNHHPKEEIYLQIKKLAAEKNIDIIDQVENPDVYIDTYSRFVENDWGRKIRTIRLYYGMLQTDFAKLVGCDEQTLASWELNYVRPMRKYFPMIEKLARAKGIRIDVLIKYPEHYVSPYEKFIEKDCGKKIKSIRLTYEMTQSEFCQLIGCTDVAISNWEIGLHVPELKCFPTIEKVARKKNLSIKKLNQNPDMSKDYYAEFCKCPYWDKIKKLRHILHLKQRDLAAYLGVSESSISLWECKEVIPGRSSYLALKKFAIAKGVDIDEPAGKNSVLDKGAPKGNA